MGLAPQELADRLEGFIFMLICLAALFIVAGADLVVPRQGTVSALALVPVTMAGWLLSRRLIVIVVVVAMAIRLTFALLGLVPPLTSLSEMTVTPLLAVVSHLAATTVLQNRKTTIAAREARQREERARDLERAKSDFLRLASHELRGPIALLRGYLAMLEDGSLGRLPPAAGEVLPVLAATAQGMSRQVELMLETARLEDGRLQLSRRRVDVSGLVRQACANVAFIHRQSHPIRCVGCDREVIVEVDPERIDTVLGNLVSNALKYSPPGTEVTVTLSVEGARVRVAVRDHGLGIDPNELKHLFTRFGRIRNRHTEHVSGTGLGLFLSRELARMHGGDVAVHSVPGEGSTFWLELPLPAGASS
jgi:signal transduction histidine kinase